ncbi:Mrpl-40 [Aphelenchoides bicaudatus]|nr:Mrpl-40 [Aphelenchoides bicaudatus]
MLSNSMLKCLERLSLRPMHTSAILSSSVFMKKQKKMDPEVAKAREQRKRRKLEREIRELQKVAKQPKPVDELILDETIKANISQYQREPVQLSAEENRQTCRH